MSIATAASTSRTAPAPYRPVPRHNPLSADRIRQNGLSPASAAVRRSAARAAALSDAGREAADGRHAEAPEHRARGFVLYVGLDELTAAAAGTTLVDIASALRAQLAALVPAAETSASIALAPDTEALSDLEAVRAALANSGEVRAPQARAAEAVPAVDDHGVVVDLARREVRADGTELSLTYKEFELLRHLVSAPGRTVSRQELIDEVWAGSADDEVPNERTVDVHVRRLRAKLGGYTAIVRTVRGLGYRFDEHPDVTVLSEDAARTRRAARPGTNPLHTARGPRTLASRPGHAVPGRPGYRGDGLRQGLGPQVQTGEAVTPRYGYGPARRAF